MTRVRPPYLRRKYPRLRSNESLLLREYLREQGSDDVVDMWTGQGVGEGEIVPSLPEPYRRAAREVSRLRADAVVHFKNRWEVVEVKSRARLGGVGQLIGYSNLLPDEDEFPTNLRLVLLAYRRHPDLRDAVRGTGVVLHTIPSADPTSASRPSSNG